MEFIIWVLATMPGYDLFYSHPEVFNAHMAFEDLPVAAVDGDKIIYCGVKSLTCFASNGEDGEDEIFLVLKKKDQEEKKETWKFLFFLSLSLPIYNKNV